MSWISIDDGQPWVRQKVWYYFSFTGVSRGEYYGDGGFGGKNGFLCGREVTHWQPDTGQEKPFGPLIPEVLSSGYPEKESLVEFLRLDDPFRRENLEAHVTCSVWVFNKELTKTLLMKHKKMGIWLQMGGHMEQGEDVRQTAKRELLEESGIPEEDIDMGSRIIHIAAHEVPERKDAPAHIHHDISFAAYVDESKVDLGKLNEAEGLDMQWFPVEWFLEDEATAHIFDYLERLGCG